MADNRNPNNTEVNVNIERPAKRLWTECNPLDQPEGTYRYALNALKGTEDGNENFLASEAANDVAIFIDNLLGSGYLGNGETVLFSIDGSGNTLIGILDKANNYTNLITTTSINFNLQHQIGCIVRIIKNGQRVVYWVDGFNDAYFCNLDALYEHYTLAYLQYLNNGGNPATYPDDKWNGESFLLIKNYSTVPQFTDVTILEYGRILPGSYSFAVQYLDSDLNPTEWITTSNTVCIYNDRVDSPFESIRGSRNVQNDIQQYSFCNKSIKVKLDNLDPNYPFFRIAIIQCAFNTGKTFKVLLSDPIDTNGAEYLYTGNDAELGIGTVEEIAAFKNNIKKPKYIEQLENRLLLANGSDVDFPFCNFQGYASLIKADLCNHETILNSTVDTSNPKNPKSTFVITGYMPGEVYAFGIVYLMEDNSLSPVYHIPGRSPDDLTTLMNYYECTNGYSDIHTCGDGENYWGNDYEGNPLLGQKVRHHKFPFRSELDPSLYFLAETFPSTTPYTIFQYQGTVTINLLGTYPIQNGQPAVFTFQVRYKLTDIPSAFVTTLTLTQSLLGTPIVFYTGDLILDPDYPPFVDPTTLDLVIFSTTFATNTTPLAQIYKPTFSKLLGINFSNIQQPPNTKGFYIVRVERTSNDRFVLDNAVIGPTVQFDLRYNTFGRMYPQIYPITSMILPLTPWYSFQQPYTQDQEPSNETSWVFSPQHQFFNDKTKPFEIQVEGTYQPLIVRYPFSPDNLYDGTTGGPPVIPGWYTVPGHDIFQTLTSYNKFGVYNLELQAGASYNSTSTAKFDVWIPYKIMDFKFHNATDDTRIGITKTVNKSYYLNASDYQLDSDVAGLIQITYYNGTCDNKIGMFTYDDYGMIGLFINEEISPVTGLVPSERTDLNYYSTIISTDVSESSVIVPNYWDLMYVAMISNQQDLYSDFLTRTYYKEHNNPIYFNDVFYSEGTPGNPMTQRNINLFNGDVKIAEFNPVNSCYLEFHRKDDNSNHTWEIVAGVILLVVAIAVNVIPGVGQAISGVIGALALSTLTGLAVSYGITLIQSGLKYEAMQRMIQTDYPNGLLQAISDTETQLIHNNPYAPYDYFTSPGPINQNCYTWYTEVLRGLYIETSASPALRCGITATGTDFFLTKDDSDSFIYTNLENYIRNKFTTVDITQGSGRLFRGYPYTEFYDLNLDYLRQNHQKSFYCLPINYDCCTKDPFHFPNRVWYSEQSFQEETVDNYKVFLPNNYRDIESEHGEITNIFKYSDQLYVHTLEALWMLPKNQQERVTDQISSFVGTGDFFSIPPKLVNDDTLGFAGSQHNWATCKTKKGTFFVNMLETKVYWLDNGVNVISNIGNETWFKNNLGSKFADFFYSIAGFDYPLLNNPASPNGLGLLSTYDNYYNRILLTKKDVVLREGYDFYIREGNVEPPLSAPIGIYYMIDLNEFIYHSPINTLIILSDTTYFYNASWTISFSIDDMAWISMHSYTPTLYIHNQNRFFSFNINESILWLHLINGTYLTFGDEFYPFVLEYVSVSNPLTIRTWDTILLNTVCRQYFEDIDQFVVIPTITFQEAIFYNSRQSSGLQTLVVKDLQVPNTRYMQQQVVNTTQELLIANRENYWRINEIRDYVSDYTVPLFEGNQYSDTIAYRIDKIVNAAAIDYTKTWYQLEVPRDRYMVIRLYYTPEHGTNIYNLMACYSIEFEKISTR